MSCAQDAAPAAPTVSITNPVNAGNQGAVGVTGLGEPGTTAIISVDDDDSRTAAVTTSTPVGTSGYGATLDLSSLTDGTVTVSVALTNAAGSTSPVSTATAIKDTAGPLTIVTVDAERDPRMPHEGGTVRGTANDSMTPVVTTTVRFSRPQDTSSVELAATCTSGCGTTASTWSITPAALRPGRYTASASSTDAAGNVGPWSPPIEIVLTGPAPR